MNNSAYVSKGCAFLGIKASSTTAPSISHHQPVCLSTIPHLSDMLKSTTHWRDHLPVILMWSSRYIGDMSSHFLMQCLRLVHTLHTYSLAIIERKHNISISDTTNCSIGFKLLQRTQETPENIVRRTKHQKHSRNTLLSRIGPKLCRRIPHPVPAILHARPALAKPPVLQPALSVPN